MSIWEACHALEKGSRAWSISDHFHGADCLMRHAMNIATEFENWACVHVCFESSTEVWPYFLHENFGSVLLEIVTVGGLMDFDTHDCLRVALRLGCHIYYSDALPLPLCLEVLNPSLGERFEKVRIEVVHLSLDGRSYSPITADHIIASPRPLLPIYGIYGVDSNGLLEHMADRSTYVQARSLVLRLFPSLGFAEELTPFQGNLESMATSTRK